MLKKLVKDFLYTRETYLIRGSCFKIWKKFGGAFKEKVVDRALEEELKHSGLKVEKGLLINFGSKKLEIKRRIYDKGREKYN